VIILFLLFGFWQPLDGCESIGSGAWAKNVATFFKRVTSEKAQPKTKQSLRIA